MTLVDSLVLGLRALRADPLRNGLAIVGIVFGIASVVDVVALGHGAQEAVAEQIRAVGADILMIEPGAIKRDGIRLKAGTKLTLTTDDLDAVRAELPDVNGVAGSLSGNAQIVRESRNWNTTINGTTSDHFKVRQWELAGGRYFSSADEEHAAKVVILGAAVARELASAAPILDTQIRIMSVPFTVIGVLKAKSADQDDVVFVPLTTAKTRFLGGASAVNRDAVAYALARARSDDALAAAKGSLESLLRRRHHIQAGQPDDFKITEPAAMIAAQRHTNGIVTGLLVAVAIVSLVLGGTSIMNMMLVSIGERTREIGLRRAVGARAADIMLQFLVEGLVLCLCGSVLGLALGAAGASLLRRMTDWPVALDGEVVVFAVTVALSTALAFVFYPARRAANLDPIDALKTT